MADLIIIINFPTWICTYIIVLMVISSIYLIICGKNSLSILSRGYYTGVEGGLSL